MLYLRRPGFLITADAGNHEFTRAQIVDGHARFGEVNAPKIGPGVVSAVDFDRAQGLTVHTSRGSCWVPAAECYGSWEV